MYSPGVERTHRRAPTATAAGRRYNEALDAHEEADAIEKDAVRMALETAGWLERPAAELLGLSKTAFRHLVTKHGLRGEYDAARAAMGYTTGRVPNGTKE